MTPIRSLAPKRCPACGTENPFRLVEGQVRCVRCGYIDGAELEEDHVTDAELEALFGDPAEPAPDIADAIDAELQRRRESFRPSYILRDKSDVDPYAEAIFSTAMDHVRRKDWDGAIHHLRRAIDHNRDLTDARLWLGRLLPDENDRRAQYKAVLSLDMQHGDALRELMVMDGELDPSRPVDDFTMPEQRTADQVAADSRGVKCPRCGAPKLNANPLYPDRLICGACGHEIVTATGGGDRSVMRALLKKRGQAIEWIVGERILACNGCGAQRTFAADQLAEHCPFCGSRNVITQDALKSLMQPDAVVPFAVDEAGALEQVRAALASGVERFKGWFNDNRYQRIDAEGIFLPYWVFDAAVDVTRTYRIREDSQRQANPHLYSALLTQTMTDRYGDAAYNVLIPGVAQPPPWMLGRIGRFDVGHTQAYAPEVIAQHGAELYTTDFDRASLEAHSAVSQAMRDKYGVNTSREQTISVFSIVKPISFRLLLLPVWAITIQERDGDMRPALVNGQSGKVAFGKAVKLK